MVKSELARVLGEAFDCSRRQASDRVDFVIQYMINALKEERRIEIRGFGVFFIRQSGGNMARNPRTGESVYVTKRLRVRFKPGKDLRDRVDA